MTVLITPVVAEITEKHGETKIKRGLTFVETLDAGVVQRLCDDFLQTVLAASTAGVHLHVAEAQLLQAHTHG